MANLASFRALAQVWDDSAAELRASAPESEPQRSIQLAIAWTCEQCAMQVRVLLRPVGLAAEKSSSTEAKGGADGS